MATRLSEARIVFEDEEIEVPGMRIEPLVLMEPIKVVSFDATVLTGVGTSSFSYVFFKRSVDVFFCCLALPFVMIPLLIIALAVRFSSPGPVLYRETRVGRFGKTFTIYKFRSMYTKRYLREVLRYDECEKTQMKRRQDQKHTRDPRVTAVGSFLRKFSLDELPQIINILKGDMSLIGPRPVVVAELQRYGRYSRFYKMMYPGLSGLWQVSGRNDVSYEKRVQLDVVYCRKWTPYLDLAILARTLPAVLKGKGAY